MRAVTVILRVSCSCDTRVPFVTAFIRAVSRAGILFTTWPTMTLSDLEPLDPTTVAHVLSNPPFVTISGVINVRDLGSLPSTSNSGQITRPRYLFRGAELSSITEQGLGCTVPLIDSTAHNQPGKAELRELGITTVFDLRSDTEIQKYDSPQPRIEGVEILHIPVFRKDDYSPETMAKYVRAPHPDHRATHPRAHSQYLISPDAIDCTLAGR